MKGLDAPVRVSSRSVGVDPKPSPPGSRWTDGSPRSHRDPDGARHHHADRRTRARGAPAPVGVAPSSAGRGVGTPHPRAARDREDAAAGRTRGLGRSGRCSDLIHDVRKASTRSIRQTSMRRSPRRRARRRRPVAGRDRRSRAPERLVPHAPRRMIDDSALSPEFGGLLDRRADDVVRPGPLGIDDIREIAGLSTVTPPARPASLLESTGAACPGGSIDR